MLCIRVCRGEACSLHVSQLYVCGYVTICARIMQMLCQVVMDLITLCDFARGNYTQRWQSDDYGAMDSRLSASMLGDQSVLVRPLLILGLGAIGTLVLWAISATLCAPLMR